LIIATGARASLDLTGPAKVDALGVYRQLESCKRVGIKRVILVSSLCTGKLFHPLNLFGLILIWKKIGENCLRNSNFEWTIIRPGGLKENEDIKKENIPYQRGGTYVVMEGPQFSTLAESNLYRSWKADVIGMTNMPEAKLAREAEIRYASVSMVTDYDCWHPDHENVDVQQVIKVLLDNAAKAKNMIKNLIENFENHIDPKDPTNNCLDVAIITAPEKRTKKTIDKLKTVAGRVLNK